MTSEHCGSKTRPGPTKHVTALIVGIWILLNAVAAAYIASHVHSTHVRQFLERFNAADVRALPNYID
jgi:CHASE1-domain containing sensor protein